MLALNVERKQEVVTATIDEWIQLLAVSQSTVISAYDSHFFNSQEHLKPAIQHAHVISQAALQRIREQLPEIGYKTLDITPEECIQDPDFWIVAEREQQKIEIH